MIVDRTHLLSEPCLITEYDLRSNLDEFFHLILKVWRVIFYFINININRIKV